tara:strand:- start:772 stop:1596 length:825 start_codon:yes stop_codon:yes gene_type:complete
MSSKSLKTPLRYPGGKSRACAKMESFFPDLLDYENYCEPFLGGGSVAIYVTKKFPHLKVWVNDLYEPLVNFWECLQLAGDIMQERLVKLKEDNPNPEKAKELFLESKKIVSDGSHVERAVAFYIVNKCSFSGLTENSSFSKQASDSNFSMRGIEKLSEYMKIIKHWKITNLSYEELLDVQDSFTYLDPPYEIKDNLYGTKGKLHKHFDHDKFAKDCSDLSSNAVLSYNSDQLIKDRFKDWNYGEFDLTYTMRSVGNYMRDQKDRKELVLFNYDL